MPASEAYMHGNVCTACRQCSIYRIESLKREIEKLKHVYSLYEQNEGRPYYSYRPREIESNSQRYAVKRPNFEYPVRGKLRKGMAMCLSYAEEYTNNHSHRRLSAGGCGGLDCPYSEKMKEQETQSSERTPCGIDNCRFLSFEPQPPAPRPAPLSGCGKPNCRNAKPLSAPPSEGPVVCPDCGGYSISGRTCKDIGQPLEEPLVMHPPPMAQESPYMNKSTCCRCGRPGREKRQRKNAKEKEKEKERNDPLTNGPFAGKLAATFGPAAEAEKAKAKGALPGTVTVIGYQPDGSPIFGPSGGPSGGPGAAGIVPPPGMKIVGCHPDGAPIFAPVSGRGGPGTGGPAGAQSAQAAAAAATAAAAAAARKRREKKDKKEPEKINQLANDIGNMYPICKYHPDCIPESGNVPWNMGWLWTVKKWYCDGKVPDFFKPGAVNKRVAKKIRADRKGHNMKDPERLLQMKKRKCKSRS